MRVDMTDEGAPPAPNEDFRSQIKRYYHELGVAIVAIALGLPIEEAEGGDWSGAFAAEPGPA